MIERAIALTLSEVKKCYKLWRAAPSASPEYVFFEFGITLKCFCLGQLIKQNFL